MTYMQRYYLDHLDYFRWYRKKHQRQTNARKRERYHNDPVYRMRELERKRRQREVKR